MKLLLCVSGSSHAVYVPNYIRVLSSEPRVSLRVVLTKASAKFVTPMACQTMVAGEVYGPDDGITARGLPLHVELAQWADLVMIVPASANTIAKLAHGMSDNLLTTSVLAFGGRCVCAPAMNEAMWNSRAVRRNIQILEGDGLEVIPGDLVTPIGCLDRSDRSISPSPRLIRDWVRENGFGRLEQVGGRDAG